MRFLRIATTYAHPSVHPAFRVHLNFDVSAHLLRWHTSAISRFHRKWWMFSFLFFVYLYCNLRLIVLWIPTHVHVQRSYYTLFQYYELKSINIVALYYSFLNRSNGWDFVCYIFLFFLFKRNKILITCFWFVIL